MEIETQKTFGKIKKQILKMFNLADTLIIEYFRCNVNNNTENFRKERRDIVLYDNIKMLCAKKGVSVSSVEKELKFSNGSICKWNESEPGIHKVQKVSDYLGVPIMELLVDEPVEQGKGA